MDEHEKFMTFETVIFISLLIITTLEIIFPKNFAEFFLRVNDYTSWILGLTVGLVIPDMISRIKSKLEKKTIIPQVSDSFTLFIANAAILTFIVALSRGVVLSFLNGYYEFFHLILTQWIILVYLWFKLANGFKISTRYVIATELMLVFFSTLILLFIK
jgi:hypothetical protein